MNFINALANNEEDLQDERFHYDDENSVEECELFKHTVYEGNKILLMEEEISSLGKFNEECITLDVISSLWFIDEILVIEMVVESENTAVSSGMKGSSKSNACPPPSLLKSLQSRAALCETYFQVWQAFFNR